MELKEWLGDNQLSLNIWKNKYQRNNETLDEWFDRVSGGNEKVKKLIQQKKFLFGGRILSNRGIKNDEKVTYSNCYVITPPEDSIESIYESRTKLARTYSYGGGCGIDISKLSPAGARVRNQAKATSGAVSFMQGYSDVTEEIGQNGRRGALMISIDCTHPDLLDFINIKTKEGSVTKANISVKVNNDFMKAVRNNEDWELSFTREETGEKISKIVKAKDIFRLLCENNWNWAEPGILYWDTISDWNLLSTNKEFKYAGVNPCAEEPLPAGGSCLLGSINLSAFVKYPYEKNSFIDLEELKEAVYIAVDALNEVLDEGMSLHPLAEQRESVQKWRQIGLGIMGLADMLIKLGIEYGSDKSLELIDLIGSTIITAALAESNNLAREYGPYPAYTDDVLKSRFFTYNTKGFDNLIRLIKLYGLRNSQLLTCAPTGSIATMLGISNGIEPLFAKSWQRKTESLHGKDVFYTERPRVIEELMEFRGIDKDEDLPDYVITAHEIDPFNRIKVQSKLQKHIDASISSTINISKDATIEDVENIYLQAWNSGLKGVTIYREGGMREGILTTEESKQEKEEVIYNKPERGEVIPVNDNDAIGFKRKLMTGCGSLHCTAFFDVNTGELVETYLSKGSTGGCNNFMVGLSRMISMASRAGVSIQDIVDQLMSTGSCPSYAARSATKHDTSKGSCCPMAVGYALKEMWEEFQGKEMKPKEIKIISIKDNKEKRNMNSNYATCPECGEQLTFEGGCNICKSCGYTKCD
ncbi:MAG: adenosylcobalamin-dependent ribonucleoside-diphosphate reductase [Clostridiales bacterium]|nr:adenosylcobalamin-dependent ribonucleoside-diphosphate reductase [Clostridiales bacterium]